MALDNLLQNKVDIAITLLKKNSCVFVAGHNDMKVMSMAVQQLREQGHGVIYSESFDSKGEIMGGEGVHYLTCTVCRKEKSH